MNWKNIAVRGFWFWFTLNCFFPSSSLLIAFYQVLLPFLTIRFLCFFRVRSHLHCYFLCHSLKLWCDAVNNVILFCCIFKRIKCLVHFCDYISQHCKVFSNTSRWSIRDTNSQIFVGSWKSYHRWDLFLFLNSEYSIGIWCVMFMNRFNRSFSYLFFLIFYSSFGSIIKRMHITHHHIIDSQIHGPQWNSIEIHKWNVLHQTTCYRFIDFAMKSSKMLDVSFLSCVTKNQYCYCCSLKKIAIFLLNVGVVVEVKQMKSYDRMFFFAIWKQEKNRRIKKEKMRKLIFVFWKELCLVSSITSGYVVFNLLRFCFFLLFCCFYLFSFVNHYRHYFSYHTHTKFTYTFCWFSSTIWYWNRKITKFVENLLNQRLFFRIHALQENKCCFVVETIIHLIERQ